MPVEIDDMQVEVTSAAPSRDAPARTASPPPDDAERVREMAALLEERERIRARLAAD